MPKLEEQLILKRCPHCKVDNPNLSKLFNCETTTFNGFNKRFWKVYSCRRCGGLLTACAIKNNDEITQMFPKAISIDSSIPLRAKEYLEQAIDSIHAPSGSIMLTASSVDAMLKEKGYKDGSLYSRIKKASDDNLITKEMAMWAHEIRLEANEQRHANVESDLPNEIEAQRTLDFAISLGQFLFVMPSKVEKGIVDAKKNDSNIINS